MSREMSFQTYSKLVKNFVDCPLKSGRSHYIDGGSTARIEDSCGASTAIGKRCMTRVSTPASTTTDIPHNWQFLFGT